MLTKRIHELTIDDIVTLTTNGVAESRFIDFKSEAIGNSDRERREFMADVTAFANAVGGDLVLGVSTKDGVAHAMSGIELADPDKEKLRLGDIIRSGAEPRLTRFEMVWLPLTGARGVLVVRTPRSWLAPHRVTLQGHDKFYVRNAAGKHPMNVDELRQAFTLSQAVVERVREFRAGRIDALRRDETPLLLREEPTLLMHIVPLSTLVDPIDVSLDHEAARELRPFGASGWSHLHSLEGFVTYPGAQDENGRVRAYTLVFRNGTVEAAGSVLGSKGHIILERVESYVLDAWKTYERFLAKHSIEPPHFVLMSLLSVQGCAPPEDAFSDVYPIPFRREVLSLPDVEVTAEEIGKAPHTLFQRPFDVLANAFGLPQSRSYNRDGTYKHKY